MCWGVLSEPAHALLNEYVKVCAGVWSCEVCAGVWSCEVWSCEVLWVFTGVLT
jgi:hypothetical protein